MRYSLLKICITRSLNAVCRSTNSKGSSDEGSGFCQSTTAPRTVRPSPRSTAIGFVPGKSPWAVKRIGADDDRAARSRRKVLRTVPHATVAIPAIFWSVLLRRTNRSSPS